MWESHPLETLWQDIRYAARITRHNFGGSALIVLVLALGIGGNAAIFTLLKAAFLDPLPYHDADRLVAITKSNGGRTNAAEALEIQSRSRTLEDVAFAEYRDMQLSGTEEPVRVFAARVTSSFFPLLGVNASLGRIFLTEENQPGRTPTVVLTDQFWRSKMGADPLAVGRTIRLDGQPAVVIGVLPQEFRFDYPTLRIPEPVDIYLSYPIESSAAIAVNKDGGPVRVLARLRQGITHLRAQAELQTLEQTLGREFPSAIAAARAKWGPQTLQVLPLREAIVGNQRSLLWLLLGGVGALLLIACANTAQLLLARSLQRGWEVAIRVALGASRSRLIQQLLLEGLVLALCGGAAGLLSSLWIVRILVAKLPARSPLLERAHTDSSVIGFTLTISVISAIVIAILPAVKIGRWMPGPHLSSGTTASANRWRHVLIAIEAALSVFLLCAAGLVAQNLWTLISTPMGFDPNHVMAMRLQLPSVKGAPLDSQKQSQQLQEYLERITAIPGVDSAATVTGPPLRRAIGGPGELLGVTDATGKLKSVLGDNHLVSPDYFRTLRIPLIAGRIFRDDDAPGRPRVAIVNQEFARQFGLGTNVIGKQFAEPGEPLTIIGMVGNVRTRGLRADPYPEVYLSSLQISSPNVYLVVRSAILPAELLKFIKGAIQSSNSDQAVFGVMTMDELIADSVTEPRFHVFLISAFALIAVIMAASGIYSVISCLVSQRIHEIAIRIALGADRKTVFRTILGPTSAWAVAGLTSGLALAFVTRNIVRSLSDAAIQGSSWIYAAVALFFLVLILIASSTPARRAATVDPMQALRCE
jgi:predicted permease